MAVKLDMRLGDCLDVLPTLEAGSVHCCVTSPPYWGLRDYGVDGQLGLEATPEEYVAKMVEVFRAVRRVLRDDGTLWLNMGDSYAANRPGGQPAPTNTGNRNGYLQSPTQGITSVPSGLKPKDLVGMPWAVAFALRADGWYLRSDIIWHKPNPMPESCTDRPTKAHEYLFLLTKSAKYFYDADAIREDLTGNAHSSGNGVHPKSAIAGSGIKANESFERCLGGLFTGRRNRRSVWTIATQPYAKAHFATFPEALVLPCILAGTSEEGCCAGCGAPYVRVTEREQLKRERPNDRTNRHEQGDGVNSCGNTVAGVDVKTVGWECTCSCVSEIDKAVVPCTVLDPFLGSGTTAKVAQQYGRSFVGCELSAEYLELARDRFKQSRVFA